MKTSTLMSYAHGFAGAVSEIVELEKAGLDVVWVPEAYSFDGVSAMGYLAARTEKVTTTLMWRELCNTSTRL